MHVAPWVHCTALFETRRPRTDAPLSQFSLAFLVRVLGTSWYWACSVFCW
jgi:hypothetical protein